MKLILHRFVQDNVILMQKVLVLQLNVYNIGINVLESGNRREYITSFHHQGNTYTNTNTNTNLNSMDLMLMLMLMLMLIQFFIL